LTLYSGVLSYDFWVCQLTSISGYQINNGTSDTDQSLVYRAALAGFGGGADPWICTSTRRREVHQELRLASHDSTNFQWLVGGYFDTEKTSEIGPALTSRIRAAPFSGLSTLYQFSAEYLP